MKQILAPLAVVLLMFIVFGCETENPEDGAETIRPIPADEKSELTVELTPLPEVEQLPEEDPLQEEEPLPEVEPLPEAEPLIEVEQLPPGQGLSLGIQAPDFALPDGNGEAHALADYTTDKNVVLVFYRGGW